MAGGGSRTKRSFNPKVHFKMHPYHGSADPELAATAAAIGSSQNIADLTYVPKSKVYCMFCLPNDIEKIRKAQEDQRDRGRREDIDSDEVIEASCA